MIFATASPAWALERASRCRSSASYSGHTQAATTQRYAHLAADPLRQAADTISGEIAAAMSGKPKGQVTPIRG